jgi:pantetheine-phosphate adenylyltransferase
LLERAFGLGSLVFIGVTDDRFVLKLGKTHRVRSYKARVRELQEFLKSRGWLSRARIVKLTDPFGPATRRKLLDALVVSQQTLSNARQVNLIRRRRGLPALKIYVVRLVKDEFGRAISSTRIRQGKVDAMGRRVR